jgi:hypothetical protein
MSASWRYEQLLFLAGQFELRERGDALDVGDGESR